MTAPLTLAAHRSDSAAARLDALFAAAHAAQGADTGNLYGGDLGPADMLAAFEALAHATPLVRFGHYAANAAIVRAVGDAPAVHLVDVGLGGGFQWDDLLARLATRPGGPPRVRLTGIDLPAPGPAPAAALTATGERLAARARALGVPFAFTALPGAIETVPLPARAGDERLVINAAFALHHTASGDGVTDPVLGRDAVLARLRAARPDALVLVEPESDHDTGDRAARLAHARAHYGLVFRVLERCLADRPGPRRTIERAFFGREIANVVYGEGPARVERHAPDRDWRRRLRAVGFDLLDGADLAASVAGALDLPSGVAVVGEDGAMRLRVDGATLVNVSAWC